MTSQEITLERKQRGITDHRPSVDWVTGQRSVFAEWAPFYDANALSDGDQLLGPKCRVFLDEAERPMNLNVGGSRSAQAEVETGIAGR